MIYFIRILLPLFFLVACGNQQPVQDESADTTRTTNLITTNTTKDTFPKGSIINHVPCTADATQSYSLYIPVTKKDTILPVIFFFDPHADGALPLQHYKSLADAFHFIMISSNNSKNGNDWNTTAAILHILFTDVQNRLLIDSNRVYTCGFSGGAKVASYAALHQNNIKEVIASCAGLPDGEPVRNFPFRFTGMAGNGDMNMTDIIALNHELDKTATKHRLILFDGKHAWPPEDIMRTAFTGLQLDAMRDKIIPSDDSLINVSTNELKQKITHDQSSHKLLDAEEECELAINLLSGLSTGANWFVKEENLITNNPAYQQQQQEAQQLFNIEQTKKQTYQQQFQQGDIAYWSATIKDLQNKARMQTAEGAMYQRLLAYLSLAFYSISNQLINTNQNEPAQYFVTLYKMADATNNEAWYFSALLNARNHNTKAAGDDLIKAAGYGFRDTARMMKQPEFTMLSPPINFSVIESKMRKEE